MSHGRYVDKQDILKVKKKIQREIEDIFVMLKSFLVNILKKVYNLSAHYMFYVCYVSVETMTFDLATAFDAHFSMDLLDTTNE